MREELANLLRSAGRAHHQAFIATNGDDPDWPEWYARYLAQPLSRLLGGQLDAGQLAVTLRNLDQEMKRVAPAADWPEYYAEWLLTHAGEPSGKQTAQ